MNDFTVRKTGTVVPIYNHGLLRDVSLYLVFPGFPGISRDIVIMR